MVTVGGRKKKWAERYEARSKEMKQIKAGTTQTDVQTTTNTHSLIIYVKYYITYNINSF